jgi:hypothetical protein
LVASSATATQAAMTAYERMSRLHRPGMQES